MPHLQKKNIIFCIFSSLALLLFSGSSVGDAKYNKASMADIAVYMDSQKAIGLPEYCQCRLADIKFREEFRSKQVPSQTNWPSAYDKLRQRYLNIFGDSWVHLHHYCFGIMRLNSALQMLAKDKEKKRLNTLNNALGEFEYMENSKKSKFPLWSQLYMYKAQVYNLLGQPENAYRARMKANRFKKIKKK